MTWYAKPRGSYGVGSDEWNSNVFAFWEVCERLGYTKEACAGMIGNSQGEGGLNPWRWQGDEVNYSMGYGLFQYTPASGYFDNYGRISSYFSPNTSTTTQTTGATPNDGIAQIECISASGKYVGGSSRVDRIKPYYATCESYQTLDNFKKITDVYGATVCWIGFFEAPRIIDEEKINQRYSWALSAYELLKDSPTPKPIDLIYYLIKIRRKRRLNV